MIISDYDIPTVVAYHKVGWDRVERWFRRWEYNEPYHFSVWLHGDVKASCPTLEAANAAARLLAMPSLGEEG